VRLQVVCDPCLELVAHNKDTNPLHSNVGREVAV
jgi:hypothetical protein